MSDVVFFILARSGSKRCPGKNEREFVPFPSSQSIVDIAVGKCLLLARTMNAKVILDTDIERLLGRYRNHDERLFVRERDPNLCGGDVDPTNIMLSHLIWMEEADRPKYAVLTQATSPFWSRSDLELAIDVVRRHHMPGMFSVNPAYKPNGCFYIVRTRDFIEQKTLFVENCGIFRMGWKDSIDIDHPWDFRAAQAVADDQVFGKRGE
jgi:CMP-N-acetylneuraminic acid synthetase